MHLSLQTQGVCISILIPDVILLFIIERDISSGEEEEYPQKRRKFKNHSKGEVKSGNEERIWRDDGTPPQLDSQARNLLMKIIDIESVSSRERLTDLINNLMAEKAAIYINNGTHTKFRHILSSCLFWEAEAVKNDFTHIMLLFDLSCYLS